MNGPRIFLSYRRSDSRSEAGRLYEALARRVAADALFMDVDTLRPGVDWVAAIEQAIAEADYVLALIGSGWADAVDADGRRRLDDPTDAVRLELEAALRQGKTTIPVLVEDAELPRAAELPVSLAPLTRRQAVRLRHQSYNSDLAALVAAITSGPTGSVTLMFTDIEGSTNLLERLRERYAVVLEEHRNIARAAFERHNGYEVDTQGDSFFVAFGSPVDAVACALDIQRAMAEQAWPDSQSVKVRIGIHTGEPTLAPTGYVGIDVHRGARVGAAAHGGQVLVSQQTRDAVDGRLAPQTELAALGVFRFKGLAEPLSVYQVNAAGLETRFPPVRTSAPEDGAPAPGDPPYNGLLRFEEEDADRFFGREQLVAQLVDTVRAGTFLAVIGASGSGKSSLIRAGVVPALKRDAGWRTIVLTPTADPLAELSAALGRPATSESLRLVAHADQPTVLVVDQFEEIFTLCRDDAVRRTFVGALMDSAGGSLHLVLSLRADFYGEVAEFPELRDQIAEHQVYIGPMEQDDLRRAIEEPARLGGWDIAPGLVELLLRDIGSEPGALPLLSHALLETWRRRRGSRMTLKGYFESGEVRGAIARSADRLYAALRPGEQQTAREILLRLTELGEGTQDTRRRAALDELVPPGESSEAHATADVLRRLVDARLVTVDEGAAEVAHEALIREWPLLREWLHEDREGLRTQRQITEAVAEWQSLNREPSLLYRGARLITAQEWADAHPRALSAGERTFLKASIEAEEHDQREREEQQQRALDAERRRAEEQATANRRLRRRALILVGALVVAAGLGVAAVMFAGQASEQATQARSEAARAEEQRLLADEQRVAAEEQRGIAEQRQVEAEEQRTAAEEQRRIALSRQLAAQSRSSVRDLDLSLLLAVEALDAADTVEARSSLFYALEYEPRLVSFLDSAGRFVAFAPGGPTLAATNADGSISLWDVGDRREIAHFGEGDFEAIEFAFSPDGRLLAAGGADGTLMLWEVAGEASVGPPISAHIGGVGDVVFAPDGATVYSTGIRDRSILAWDVATGQQRGEALEARQLPFSDLAISPDGSTLASGSLSDLELWDTQRWRSAGLLRSSSQGGIEGSTLAVSFSHDGRIVAGSDGLTIFLWDAQTLAPIRDWHANVGGFAGEGLIANQSTSSISFSPDDRLLAWGRSDGTIGVWDVASGTLFGEPLIGPEGGIGGVVFNSVGTLLAAPTNGQVGLWALEPDEGISVSLEGSDPITSVAFERAGTTLATGAGNTISTWDTTTRSPATTIVFPADPAGFPTLRGPTSDMVFGPDRSLYAYAAPWVWAWDPKTGQEIAEPFQLHGSGSAEFEEPPRAVALSADGRTVVSTSGDLAAGSNANEITVWDLDLRERVGTIGPPTDDETSITSLAITNDGRYVASARRDGPTVIWDLTTGIAIATLNELNPLIVRRMAFSGDGTLLATGDDVGRVVVWDIATRQSIGGVLAAHTAQVESLAFSPDGKFLASASPDFVTWLWDIASGQAIGTLPGQVVAFSADGSRLAIGGEHAAKVYDMSVASWRAAACRIANRDLTTDEWRRFLRDEEYRATCT